MKRIQTVVFENLLASQFFKVQSSDFVFYKHFLKCYGEKGRVIDSYKQSGLASRDKNLKKSRSINR